MGHASGGRPLSIIPLCNLPPRSLACFIQALSWVLVLCKYPPGVSKTWPVCMTTNTLKFIQFIGLDTRNQRSCSKLMSKAGPEMTRGVWQQPRSQGEALGIKYWRLVHRDWGLAPVLGRLCGGTQGPVQGPGSQTGS